MTARLKGPLPPARTEEPPEREGEEDARPVRRAPEPQSSRNGRRASLEGNVEGDGEKPLSGIRDTRMRQRASSVDGAVRAPRGQEKGGSCPLVKRAALAQTTRRRTRHPTRQASRSTEGNDGRAARTGRRRRRMTGMRRMTKRRMRGRRAPVLELSPEATETGDATPARVQAELLAQRVRAGHQRPRDAARVHSPPHSRRMRMRMTGDY